MPAPRDIVDGLECVVSIYFSEVRHRLRASFILTDELVEMCCKALAIAHTPTLGHIKFLDLLKHPAVDLNPKTTALGAVLWRSHDTRNKMQHGNAAFTVDEQHCADAILDGVDAIDHCFAGASSFLPEGLKIALRVLRLHSTKGNASLRGKFEDEMRRHPWNGAKRRAPITDPPIPVGTKRYWGMVILPEYIQVEAILNRLGIP
jgi:hypothetical protein